MTTSSEANRIASDKMRNPSPRGCRLCRRCRLVRTATPSLLEAVQRRARRITVAGTGRCRSSSEDCTVTPQVVNRNRYFLRRPRITKTPPASSAMAAAPVEASTSGAAFPATRKVAMPPSITVIPRSLIIRISRLDFSSYFLRRPRITRTPPASSANAAAPVDESISGAESPAIKALAIPPKITAIPRNFVICETLRVVLFVPRLCQTRKE